MGPRGRRMGDGARLPLGPRRVAVRRCPDRRQALRSGVAPRPGPRCRRPAVPGPRRGLARCPFGIGYAITGTLAGAFVFFLWAGLIRMALLHHVTWSINSICHIWGRRPFVNRRPEHERRPTRPGVLRRELAQLPPRGTGLSPSRGAGPPVRPVRRSHPGLRAGRLGDQGALADQRLDRRADGSVPVGSI